MKLAYIRQNVLHFHMVMSIDMVSHEKGENDGGEEAEKLFYMYMNTSCQ